MLLTGSQTDASAGVAQVQGEQALPLARADELLAFCATNWATAWIWAGVSCPRNTGIPPPPFSTCFATVAVLGLSWSRLGPTIA
jgi:hypothetical protein